MTNAICHSHLAPADQNGPAIERGEISCINNLCDLEALKQEWSELEQKSLPDMAYFQSYDWCRTWWLNHHPQGEDAFPRLQVYTLRRNGRLLMIWPLMVERGPFGFKVLTVLGGTLSQYGGVLADHDQISEAEILECWSGMILHADVDAIAVDRVPQRSLLAQSLKQLGLATVVETTSIINLADGGAHARLLNPSKASSRKNRKRRRKKLADGKSLELVAIPASAPEYAEISSKVFQWKATWLHETGRPSGGLGDKGTKNFISSLTEGVHALVLKHDGKAIAAEIGFQQGEHFYSYIGAFDWSLRRLSPGRVQIEEALSWLIAQDVKYYDLLGAPSSYKQDMSDLSIGMESFLYPKTVLGRLYVFGWRKMGRPFLKRAFYRSPINLRRRLMAGVRGISGMCTSLRNGFIRKPATSGPSPDRWNQQSNETRM